MWDVALKSYTSSNDDALEEIPVSIWKEFPLHSSTLPDKQKIGREKQIEKSLSHPEAIALFNKLPIRLKSTLEFFLSQYASSVSRPSDHVLGLARPKSNLSLSKTSSKWVDVFCMQALKQELKETHQNKQKSQSRKM